MIVFPSYRFYLFLNTCTHLYFYSVILLLLATVLMKNGYRSESYNLLYTFNTLAAWSCLFYIISYLSELFIAWYGQNPYEWYVIKSGGSGSWIWFFIKVFLPLLTGLLFFYIKFRNNRIFSFLFLLLQKIGMIEKAIYSLYGDYLPSSWSNDHSDEMRGQSGIDYLIIIGLLLTIYVFAKKKNKLPYPSVFLKQDVQ